MFVDTSAILALLADEPDAGDLASKLAAAKVRYTSGTVILEASVLLSAMLDLDPSVAETYVHAMIEEADIFVISVTASIAGKAVAAATAYGQGRPNRAQLTLTQCLSYACAQAYRVPLLCKGGGFAETDLKLA